MYVLALTSYSPAMQDAKEFPKQVTSFFYSHMAFPMEETVHNSKAAFTHSLDPSSVEYLGFKGHHGLVQAEGCSENYPSNLVPAFSDPVNLCSTTFMFGADQWVCSNSAMLNFEHKLGHGEDSRISIDANMDHQYQMRSGSCISLSDTNCFRMASSYGFTGSEVMDNSQQLGIQQSIGQDKALQLHKRPFVVGDMQASKKHCGNTRKQTKATKATKAKENPSKDPQSIAAKNRRERISERLKILQGLVPNGTKVDLVTMLEKAISYVKFLQVQVKVLATDEFWPAQGGKVPEISQVKEAIDAIISSHHRDRNSCSKH